MLESSVKSSAASATLCRMMTHLPAARTSNNPHTLSGRDLERDVVQDLWAILQKCCQNMTQHDTTCCVRAHRGVSRREPLDYEVSTGGPVRGRHTVGRRLWLLLDGEILLYALQAVKRKLQYFASCFSIQVALTCYLRTTESRLEQLSAIHYYKHTVNLEGVEDPDHGEYHPTERGCGAVIQIFSRDSETRRIWTY